MYHIIDIDPLPALDVEKAKLGRIDEYQMDVKKPWNTSDLVWITPNSEQSLHYFQKLFDELKVSDKLSHIGEIVMFCGFYVIRQHTTTTRWHFDFVKTNNRAFTMMTPLQSMAQEPSHLLYKKTKNGPIHRFKYKYGHGIVFGDRFLHTTEDKSSSKPLSFLCFTMGDKNMSDTAWENAEIIISGQSEIYKDIYGNVIYN